MTTPPSHPRRPPGRYDEPRALPRSLLILGAAALVAALTAGAWWAYERSRQGRLDFATTGYHVDSDSSVTVSFEVHKPRGRVASCAVEALDRDGARVGSATVRVTDTHAQVSASQQLSTTGRAATALVTGCRVEPSPTPAGP